MRAHQERSALQASRGRSLGGFLSTIYSIWGDGIGGIVFRVEFFHRLITGVVFLEQVAFFIEFDAIEAYGIVGGLLSEEGSVLGSDGGRNNGNGREGDYGHCAGNEARSSACAHGLTPCRYG